MGVGVGCRQDDCWHLCKRMRLGSSRQNARLLLLGTVRRRLLGRAATQAKPRLLANLSRPLPAAPCLLLLAAKQNFLYMLDAGAHPGYRPNPRLARALDILFILHAEHELNCR